MPQIKDEDPEQAPFNISYNFMQEVEKCANILKRFKPTQNEDLHSTIANVNSFVTQVRENKNEFFNTLQNIMTGCGGLVDFK